VKSLFITSLFCAFISLLALVGLSAMTTAPQAHSFRDEMVLATGLFFVGWVFVAFLSRPRQHKSFPQWLERALIVAGIVYSFGVFLLVFG
jgi:uncharacterized membrane protein YhdT